MRLTPRGYRSLLKRPAMKVSECYVCMRPFEQPVKGKRQYCFDPACKKMEQMRAGKKAAASIKAKTQKAREAGGEAPQDKRRAFKVGPRSPVKADW